MQHRALLVGTDLVNGLPADNCGLAALHNELSHKGGQLCHHCAVCNTVTLSVCAHAIFNSSNIFNSSCCKPYPYERGATCRSSSPQCNAACAGDLGFEQGQTSVECAEPVTLPAKSIC
jgi:hypothetical protein